VSIQDEGQFRVRLGSLLDDVDPRPAPVGVVVRQGRGIRQRRRALAAGGIAVIAAAAVLGPTVLRSDLSAPPVAPALHYNVTVSPPAKGAKPGVIATGSINGWHWRATLLGTGNTIDADFGPRFQKFQVFGPTPNPGDMADFNSAGPQTVIAYAGVVAPAVQYITMDLANGEALTLHPEKRGRGLYIAMVLPAKVHVIESVAYGVAGELGYAIPFNYGGSATFQTWLKPGQPAPARATARIGFGGSGRSRWSATAYVGPWGICGEVVEKDGSEGFCGPASGIAHRGLLSPESFGGGPGSIDIVYADPRVAALVITRSNGSLFSVHAVRLPGFRYGLLAFIEPAKNGYSRWSAYDVHGTRLGSGRGDPAA
jgi:hypothetical protein